MSLSTWYRLTQTCRSPNTLKLEESVLCYIVRDLSKEFTLLPKAGHQVAFDTCTHSKNEHQRHSVFQ